MSFSSNVETVAYRDRNCQTLCSSKERDTGIDGLFLDVLLLVDTAVSIYGLFTGLTPSLRYLLCLQPSVGVG